MQKKSDQVESVAILKWFFWRLLIGVVLFFVLNFIYEKTLYPSDLKKYSSVKTQIDTAFQDGDIIYLGESSNTSFNPWTDTLQHQFILALAAHSKRRGKLPPTRQTRT